MEKNTKIGEMLKYYRKQNGMTIEQVVAALHEQYQIDVAEKTVYGWESNQAHPTSDVFVAICEMYCIRDLGPLFPKNPQAMDLVLSAEEKELVRNFRRFVTFQPAIRQLLQLTPPRRNRPHRD